MRYFRDTMSGKILFLAICNCQISCFSFSALPFGETEKNLRKKKPFEDVRVAVVQIRSIKGKIKAINIYMSLCKTTLPGVHVCVCVCVSPKSTDSYRIHDCLSKYSFQREVCVFKY